MKTAILTMIFGLGFALAASAQSTDKGTFTVGGGVSYSYQKTKDVPGNTQSFSILPTVGYFPGDNFQVGLGLGYTNQTSKFTSNVKSTSDYFTVSPYARYYLGKGDVKFFGQLSIPLGWGKSTSNDNDSKTQAYGVALSPGVVFFPGKKVGIEFSVKGLYYNHSSYKAKGTSDVETTSFGLNANSMEPTIGVNFYF